MTGRILVADDDPASADLLVAFLQSHGFEVATAADGNRALEMGTSGEFELVILDVHMPLYDGLEVLEIVRKKDANELWDAGDNLDQACESCHLEYWYPGDKALLQKIDRRIREQHERSTREGSGKK